MFRIGVAGCGYWGVKILRTLAEMEGVVVEALSDPDPQARSEAASIFGGSVKTHNAFEMLLADKIDGVVIASPPNFHVEQAVAALNRGKAVFVEKPPVMNVSDMRRLLEAAHGKTLVCDYVFCYNPLVQFARGLMYELDFQLVTADLRWTNRGIVRTDVDAWWSVGTHPVSVLAFLFKQIWKRDWLRRGGGWARASYHVPGDSPSAGVFVSWLHPTKERRIELVGKERTILIDDVSRKLWVVHNRDGKISVPRIEYKPMPLTAALMDFLSCARTGGEPICGPSIIEEVTEMMT